MPTLVELCGTNYPKERNGVAIQPEKGESLAPLLKGRKGAARTLYMEHEGNRMVREGNWKPVVIHDCPWELYNLTSDPTEMRNLVAREPARVRKMSQEWDTWAENNRVKTRSSPQIAGKPLTIRCDVTPLASDGVILAQGGQQRGYSLYLKGGRPVFSVRENSTLHIVTAPDAPKGPRYSLEARLASDGTMTLVLNGKIVARGKAPGLIQTQPQDGLSIGEDTLQRRRGLYRS